MSMTMLDRNSVSVGTMKNGMEINNNRANTPSACSLLKDSHWRQWGDLFFVVEGDETRTSG